MEGVEKGWNCCHEKKWVENTTELLLFCLATQERACGSGLEDSFG